MRLRPFWSYYGSRWQMVPRYPRPSFPRIIEPFAGGAAYALHYPEHEVLLCDLDPVVAGVWGYLIRVSEDEIRRLPDAVHHVDELGPVPQEARWLVGFWLGRCLAAPRVTVGSWMAKRERERRPSCFWDHRAKARIIAQLRYIRHWRVRCADYRGMSDEGPATWFIDPPFQGHAGRRYRKGCTGLDFAQLGDWSRQRSGQVLVCEQGGAAWLPFAAAGASRCMIGERPTLLWSNRPLPGQLELL